METRRTIGSVFVGRERELDELSVAVDDAAEGHGRLYLVSGEPGIGKTRLCGELASLASERGARVVWGHCSEAEGAPAFWPWIQVLRTAIRSFELNALEDSVGPNLRFLAPVVPELGPLDAPPESEHARFFLFDAATGVLRETASSVPLVVILDDLHWADLPSLSLLEFVARHLPDLRILLAGAYREHEVAQDGSRRRLIGDAARHGHHLALRGLAEPDVAKLAKNGFGLEASRALVSRLHSVTGGNPFFLDEYLRLGEADDTTELPQGVRETIRRRLDSLSSTSRRLLEIGAVLGREFGLGPVEQIASLRRTECLEELDAAVRAGMLLDMPAGLGQYRFVHDLIRETLYDDLPVVRRFELHGRAADVLEDARTSATQVHVSEVAHHLLEAAPAGDVGRAVSAAIEAGEHAKSRYAYEEAAALFGRALEATALDPDVDERVRCRVLIGLAESKGSSGSMTEAHHMLADARELARRLGESELFARATMLYIGTFLSMRGDAAGRGRTDAIPLLEEALAGLGEDPSVLRLEVMSSLMFARTMALDEAFLLDAERVEDLAERLDGLRPRKLALQAEYQRVWWRCPHDLDACRKHISNWLRFGQETGDVEAELVGQMFAIPVSLIGGDRDGALTALQALERHAEQLRVPGLWTQVYWNRASVAIMEGRFEDAENEIENGMRAAGENAHLAELITYQRYSLLRERGELEQFEPMLSSLAQVDTPRAGFRCVWAHYLGEYGRLEECRQVFEGLAADGFACLGALPYELPPNIVYIVEPCAILDDAERAAQLYQMLLPFDGQCSTGLTPWFGTVAQYLGVLAATMGRFDDADRHFTDGIRLSERMHSSTAIARTKLEWGRMLVRREDWTRARPLLTDALEIATDLGMKLVAERAETTIAELAPPTVRAVSEERRAVLRPDGDHWTIRYSRQPFRLKTTKGLEYLHRLLCHPGREFHALELTAADGALAADVLDAFRDRVEELRARADEAEANGDVERASDAKLRLEQVTAELAGAMADAGAAERARVNVTRNIRKAIARIAAQDAVLGRHLDTDVRTGAFCSYEPDPRQPLAWDL